MLPDLSTPIARAAYRRELRGLARGQRRAGLIFMLSGVALLAWPRMGGPWYLGPMKTQSWGWLAIGLGWLIWGWVIWYRSRYHRRRMADG